ncbi:SGNH/GDSL hydrolase family protein [Mariprofundus sp. NF]|uniref:SGNH/GDSL hydrolase family protein n=1 Tax=Mariprofundus sp. NF TaxID=2608716 RepID=UPI0015A102A4|nr:SGNH/GDSL hydrolase family protein [Mariprofundus sp. NF]NWF39486.1 SGNH/GDSL hydrolase family protein [Mariprofundus sp. NF]
MKTFKQMVINTCLIGMSCLFALAVVEAYLRVTDFSMPSLYHFSPDHSGAMHRPNAHGWHRSEGITYIRINSAGLRDREHSILKADNTYRIAIIGDSYAEALQVEIEETFWSKLESLLQQNSFADGKKIEVINFGVSGYGTADELLALQSRVWSYSPDMVLLAFLTGNDIRNNSKALEPRQDKPFWVIEGGKLIYDDSFLKSEFYKKRTSELWRTLQKLSDHIRVLQLLRFVKDNLFPSTTLSESESNGLSIEAGIDDAIYSEPKTKVWIEAWQVTEALIAKVNQEVQKHKARFLLVCLSNSAQVYPAPDERKKLMEKLGVSDLFYPDKRIYELGEALGIEVLLLAPFLQKVADEKKVHLHGFDNTKLGVGHWNKLGHSEAASVISDYLLHKPL